MFAPPEFGLGQMSTIQNLSMEAGYMTKKTKRAAQKDKRAVPKRANRRPRRKVRRRSEAVIHQNILASE